MKTSKKILLTITGLVTVFFIIGLVLVRYDLQSLIAAESKIKYKAVSVGNFKKLDFSSNWIVSIKQGNEYKVELARGESDLEPSFVNTDGTLYCKLDSTLVKKSTRIHARIIAPSLSLIKAIKGTKINLANFQADSISLILEDGSDFTGTNNQFKFISFKTSGNVLLQLNNDESIE